MKPAILALLFLIAQTSYSAIFGVFYHTNGMVFAISDVATNVCGEKDDGWKDAYGIRPDRNVPMCWAQSKKMKEMVILCTVENERITEICMYVPEYAFVDPPRSVFDRY